MTMDIMIDLEIQELEDKLIKQQNLVIKVSKYCNWKIIGKYFIPKLIKEKAILQDTFRELREITRQAYPERFIQS
jgi:hypothetical protein